MKLLNYNSNNFWESLDKHLSLREEETNFKIDVDVKKIIEDVKKYGDDKIIQFARDFDDILLLKNKIKISDLKKFYSLDSLNKDTINSFRIAISNVKNYHERQFPKDYEINNNHTRLKSIWKPMDSVGLYIPGGKAVYPSSLIMSVIPAQIAGVNRIACVTPPSNNLNPYVAFLLDELNIKEVYQVGGAQAIAALTFGTQTIKPVNKIFGPGNAYVASAKKQVFGKVGIDLIAGPSEIIVVADDSNNPEWVASDLMAQAEHDENAQSILITNSNVFSNQVLSHIKNLLKKLSKKETINKSLQKNGLIIEMKELSSSHKIINYIAPEHLHLQAKEKEVILNKVNNVGGIFLGDYSSEAFGDYVVGTNHVLPTSGAAKFSSGLGVIDFMKKTSLVEVKKLGFDQLAVHVENIADVESLDAHKLSVKIRQTKKN
ncbi:histidinol dehydrogenase [Alphaproteobacteria bacterium]|nr:histidinol dehydrogenase [Alphaproteobacteria bacterium]